jgi:hypothetical protein
MIDLKAQYGKRYVVKKCPCEGDHLGDPVQWHEIHGKRGYIRMWGSDELEVYISNMRIAARVEREFKAFKPKNHYDDATSFVIPVDQITLAAKLIKAKRRRQMTPELLKHLAEARAMIPNHCKRGTLGA